MIMASKVWFEDEKIFVELNDQRIVGVPLTLYPKLKSATTQERKNFELWENGSWIHWEALDEDLSIEGLLNPELHHPV